MHGGPLREAKRSCTPRRIGNPIDSPEWSSHPYTTTIVQIGPTLLDACVQQESRTAHQLFINSNPLGPSLSEQGRRNKGRKICARVGI